MEICCTILQVLHPKLVMQLCLCFQSAFTALDVDIVWEICTLSNVCMYYEIWSPPLTNN